MHAADRQVLAAEEGGVGLGVERVPDDRVGNARRLDVALRVVLHVGHLEKLDLRVLAALERDVTTWPTLAASIAFMYRRAGAAAALLRCHETHGADDANVLPFQRQLLPVRIDEPSGNEHDSGLFQTG
jgi:hypothetical protein